MKTNNKLNKIRSKAKDVCVWIVIGLVIGCIVGWSTHTAIYNITHKEPEVSVGYVTGKLENIGELATQKLTYSGKVPLEEGSIPFITKKGFVMEYNARVIRQYARETVLLCMSRFKSACSVSAGRCPVYRLQTICTRCFLLSA